MDSNSNIFLSNKLKLFVDTFFLNVRILILIYFILIPHFLPRFYYIFKTIFIIFKLYISYENHNFIIKYSQPIQETLLKIHFK